jgi:hypothetical protein
MDLEEVAKKVTLKDLRPIAKEHGIRTICVKKIDIVRQLPRGCGGACKKIKGFGRSLGGGMTCLLLVAAVVVCARGGWRGSRRCMSMPAEEG